MMILLSFMWVHSTTNTEKKTYFPSITKNRPAAYLSIFASLSLPCS